MHPSVSHRHGAVIVEAPNQSLNDRRETGQLLEVGRREMTENPPAFGGENEPDDAPVDAVGDAPDEARLLGTVDELDGAVMAQQEMIGHLPDRG